MTIQELQSFIDAHWRRETSDYPSIANMNEEQVRAFHRGHALRHIHKQLGALESMWEMYEHGNTRAVTYESEREHCSKMIINILRYAHVAGFTGADIQNWITSFYEKKSGA
ncbi:hypothetical protein HYV72_00140 [Candidatus Uhrbacteria bacterium]|nr:hypothetical protein [Candidatus Uhrbacteria bacterium]